MKSSLDIEGDSLDHWICSTLLQQLWIGGQLYFTHKMADGGLVVL